MKKRQKVPGIFNKDLTMRLIDKISIVSLSPPPELRKANT